jgi:ketosteroid isomerase-like protein
MSEANKRVALQFLKAMNEADAAGQEDCLTEDVVTHTHGFGKVSGTRNRETMLATVDAFKAILPGGFNPKFNRVTAEGNVVVVEWDGDAVLSNGVPYHNEYVFIFTFTGGKISRLDEYFCTVHADATIYPLLLELSEAMAKGN